MTYKNALSMNKVNKNTYKCLIAIISVMPLVTWDIFATLFKKMEKLLFMLYIKTIEPKNKLSMSQCYNFKRKVR